MTLEAFNQRGKRTPEFVADLVRDEQRTIFAKARWLMDRFQHGMLKPIDTIQYISFSQYGFRQQIGNDVTTIYIDVSRFTKQPVEVYVNIVKDMHSEEYTLDQRGHLYGATQGMDTAWGLPELKMFPVDKLDRLNLIHKAMEDAFPTVELLKTADIAPK